MATPSDKPRLDIFETLRNIDKGNIEFYDNLDAEMRKQFAPIVVTQWLAGSGDPVHLMLINEYVNKYVFSLHKHPFCLDFRDLLNKNAEGRPYATLDKSERVLSH